MGLFHELVPQSAVTDVFINPASRSAELVRNEIENAAACSKRRVRIVYVRSETEIDRAFHGRGPTL